MHIQFFTIGLEFIVYHFMQNAKKPGIIHFTVVSKCKRPDEGQYVLFAQLICEYTFVVICECTFEHAYGISEIIHKKILCVLNSDTLGESTDKGDGEEERRAMTHWKPLGILIFLTQFIYYLYTK